MTMPATLEALAQALDELIDRDPDLAERVIEKHLGRLALKKRLAAYRAEKASEGFKLVPIEPTAQMLAHAEKTLPGAFSIGDEYRAMLAVAPSP